MNKSASILLLATLCVPTSVQAQQLAKIPGVESQPLKAQAKRVVSALEFLGEPLAQDRQAALDAALKETDSDKSVRAIQQALDPLCLAEVNINPESRVKVSRGPAAAALNEQGWQVFLLKVHNQAGVTAR